jgi:DNA adenine methylase
MQYSPLCYPGSKKQLVPVIKKFMGDNNIIKPIFAESHCGSASVGLELLMNGDIEQLILNDLDNGIASFWYSILHHTEKFIKKIEETPVNIEEWLKQREIYNNASENSHFLELGFAAFYLNRTNFSGIIKGSARGGFKQTGDYPIDCRFNKDELINRINRVSQYSSQISCYNQEAIKFIEDTSYYYNDFYNDRKNVFFYIDPPYYRIGKRMYSLYYKDADHIELEKCIRNIKNKWLLSYDKCDFIEDLYSNYCKIEHPFLYAANGRIRKNELLIGKWGEL